MGSESAGEAHVDAEDGEGHEPLSTDLLKRASATLDTFVTDSPDIEAFEGLFSELAHEAHVLPDSIVRDEQSGVVTGELAVPGLGLTGTFEYTRHTCTIQMSLDEDLPSPMFVGRQVTLRMRHDGLDAESGAATVQYRPDTSSPPSAFLEEGDVRYIGWGLRTDQNGTSATPLFAKPYEGDMWYIGQVEGAEPELFDWRWSRNTYDEWLRMLRVQAQR